MKKLLTLAGLGLFAFVLTGCNSVNDSRAEHDNHRQSIVQQGRGERSPGDVGQPR